MSSINFTCDSCGREVLGCTWVNGMKFCAKCYQETFGNNTIFTNKTPSPTETFVDLLNKEMYELKIADLEAKLAESEKGRLMWQEMYKSADRQNKSICETDIYPLQEENQQLKQQLAEKEKRHNQDKIELLEKVKNKIDGRISVIYDNYMNDIYDEKERLDMQHENVVIREYIDTLITQIKGE